MATKKQPALYVVRLLHRVILILLGGTTVRTAVREWTVEKMIKKFNLNITQSTSEDGIHWEYRPNREDVLKKINEIIDVVNFIDERMDGEENG